MLRLIRVAAMLMLAVAAPVRAEWIQVGVSNSGARWYMDGARIRTVGSHKQAWIKVDHSRDPTVTYRSSLELFSFNCSAQTSKLLSYVDYDSYGKTVRTHSEPDYGADIGYSPVVPDSIGETMMTVVCAADDPAS